MSTSSSSSSTLKIGIVGFGPFGQFLAKTMIKQGHTLRATSRTDYSQSCLQLGIQFFRDLIAFIESENDVILICTSILSLSEVLSSMPLSHLKRPTLFVDVLSVKEHPRDLLLRVLPEESDILCTHPMFGPDSGKDGWKDLTFVYDKVRIRDEAICFNFLNIFASEDLVGMNVLAGPCQILPISVTLQPSFASLVHLQVLEKRLSHVISMGSGSHLEEFPLQVLVEATNNFSEEKKIGMGSFSSVYHATLEDGKEVVIKRAEFSSTSPSYAVMGGTKQQEVRGCRMLQMSCEEHDKVAAKSQFITHTIGRTLAEMDIKSTPIDTKGFQTLVQLKDTTIRDSFDLYSGLFIHNRFAKQELENLEHALHKVKEMLVQRMSELGSEKTER